jgi:hypothetical protein
MRKHLLKRPSPAMVVACLALFVALSAGGYAATGGNFILGQANSATSQTSLTAPVGGGKVLQLTNTNTAAGAEGLGITVGSNKAPIRVNANAGKAANLNADKLDGKDSTQLSPASGDGRTADLALNGTQLVLSTNITTAGPSTLLASAALQLDGNGDELVLCIFAFDNLGFSPQYLTRIVETGRPIDVTSFSIVWAQGVGAGAHTVDLRCNSDPGTAVVDNAGMTVSAHL